MTPDQKEEIHKLRLQGLGYKAIASELHLMVDTVKGYCKRHDLNGQVEVLGTALMCMQCQKSIRQKKRGRTKKFCSDGCRYTWWNQNADKRDRKDTAIYHYTCHYCNRQFSAYGNKLRKFCSNYCFVKFRFGGEDDGIQEISD